MKTRREESASSPGAGGGAGAAGRGEARAKGAQRPGRPLGVTGGLAVQGAFRYKKHFRTSNGLELRQRGGGGESSNQDWGEGIECRGRGVDYWGCGRSGMLEQVASPNSALSKSFGFLAGKLDFTSECPGLCERSETTGEGDWVWAHPTAARVARVLFISPPLSWLPALGQVSVEYHE